MTPGPAHPLTPYPPLIINVALTGMIPRRETVPDVPVTPEQIVDDAVACHGAGATIVHLHARDADEAPTWKRDVYAEFIPAIRARCPGLVICVSTSGRTFPDFDQRADVLDLSGAATPDMASLTLGSLNFRDGPSVTSLEMVHALAERMAERGIKPELEIFDHGMASYASVLLERGLASAPLYANVLLGNPNTAPARASVLSLLVDELPQGTVWAAAGIGDFQLPANGLAVFMGGHVRIGLEDNRWLDRATRTPATNEQLTRRIAELARLAGRRLATVDETRATLGLPPLA
ncbi:MAG: 3-keto-5-aminohexanoate cleavage protein [Solirubrobacteraceae bacterium]